MTYYDFWTITLLGLGTETPWFLLSTKTSWKCQAGLRLSLFSLVMQHQFQKSIFIFLLHRQPSFMQGPSFQW